MLRNSCKTNECMALFSCVMTLHPDKMTGVAFVPFEGETVCVPLRVLNSKITTIKVAAIPFKLS